MEVQMFKLRLLALSAGPALFAVYAYAAAPIVYPAKGQSQEQQSKDQYECHQWAVQQSGFDPSAASSSAQASPQSQKMLGRGSQPNAVRGGARGAALGAVGGAIAGDAGKGAAAGAAIGGLGGAIRRRDQQSAQASAPPASPPGLDAYNRAIAACLTGRGYTVQ
jgi:OmpA family protein